LELRGLHDWHRILFGVVLFFIAPFALSCCPIVATLPPDSEYCRRIPKATDEKDTSSFDAGCCIDVQPICGVGLETTGAILHESSEAEAEELVALLLGGICDFDDFTPEEALSFDRPFYAPSCSSSE
jgi:hypothetical protein